MACEEVLVFRWWQGGVAGVGSVLLTHPARLLLSHPAPAPALPALLGRQLLYTLPTFGLYQHGKREPPWLGLHREYG